MYGREQRVLLRHYLERGLSKAEIARELGVVAPTVYHWIDGGQLDRDLDDAAVRYAPRPPVARKLDPFHGRSSRRAWPSFPSCRRCGCSRRSAPRATRAATRS